MMLTLEDYLVLYTDGVTEARRGGELFGEQRLLEVVFGPARPLGPGGRRGRARRALWPSPAGCATTSRWSSCGWPDRLERVALDKGSPYAPETTGCSRRSLRILAIVHGRREQRAVGHVGGRSASPWERSPVQHSFSGDTTTSHVVAPCPDCDEMPLALPLGSGKSGWLGPSVPVGWEKCRHAEQRHGQALAHSRIFWVLGAQPSQLIK